MKCLKSIRCIFSLSLMLLGVNVLGQGIQSGVVQSVKTISLNDKTKLRIFDGQIVDDSYVITSFESVQYLGRLDAAEFRLKLDRPVLIINSAKSEIESEILIKLFSQKKFLEEFKYPLDTRLPIAVNNVQLSHEEREKLLSKIKMKDIRSVKYLDRDKTSKKYRNLPFGVIEINY